MQTALDAGKGSGPERDPGPAVGAGLEPPGDGSTGTEAPASLADKEFWTVTDLAGAAGLTVQAVRKHLHNGTLLGIQLPSDSNRPGQWVIERERALDYLRRAPRSGRARESGPSCPTCRQTQLTIGELQASLQATQEALDEVLAELRALATRAAAGQAQLAVARQALSQLAVTVAGGR